MDYDKLIAPAAKAMRPSGIRKFFDLAADMPECISLGVGEPDFKTPWAVREAGIESLEHGRTRYTANAGLKELRAEICRYLERRMNLHYDPLTQVLVTVAVLAALLILLRLFARGFALLRALGAPARFVFAVAWGHAAAMILAGTLAGLALGFAAAGLIAAVVTRRTDVAIAVAPGWPELHFVAGFLSVTLLLALAPAAVATRRPILTDLRG